MTQFQFPLFERHLNRRIIFVYIVRKIDPIVEIQIDLDKDK